MYAFSPFVLENLGTEKKDYKDYNYVLFGTLPLPPSIIRIILT
jgi:hypothetical protein